MDPTNYSFAVQFINFNGEIVLISYFQITVNPSFRLQYNYPQAIGTNFGVEYFYVGTTENRQSFNLNESSLITESPRIKVLNWADDLDYPSISEIRVTVSNDNLIDGAKQESYTLDTEFNF